MLLDLNFLVNKFVHRFKMIQQKVQDPINSVSTILQIVYPTWRLRLGYVAGLPDGAADGLLPLREEGGRGGLTGQAAVLPQQGRLRKARLAFHQEILNIDSGSVDRLTETTIEKGFPIFTQKVTVWIRFRIRSQILLKNPVCNFLLFCVCKICMYASEQKK